MRKAVKIGFIGVFCAVIGLAFPVFNIFSKQLSMDSHENRLITGLPQVLQSPVNAGLYYALFGTSQSDQVLPGKDGWLFYKDGPNAAQPMANYQGLAELNDSADTLAEASAGLQILSDKLAENGCTLVLDLTPSKDRIYREYMPDGYPIVNEENRTDLLAAYLQSHTTVPVVWRYDMLRSQARQNADRLLYYKTDTGDMANVAALYASLPAEETYVVPGYDRMFEKDSRTVRVIGDSFSEYYMPYLQARFTNSWREHIDTFTTDVAVHPGCDILILEFNERSLDKLLAILEQF